MRAGHEECNQVWRGCFINVCCTKVSDAALLEGFFAGCFWFPGLSRASPVHHFCKTLHLNLTWVSVFGWRNTCSQDFRFLFPPVVPSLNPRLSSPLSRRERLDVDLKKPGGSVTPAQGCCPCSVCVWGTAFALTESAAGRGNMGIIRNRMQLEERHGGAHRYLSARDCLWCRREGMI